MNCVAKLANWGLQLAFTKKAKTELTFLSRGSNNLNDQNAAIIVDDLKHKRITLTKITKDSSGLKKRAARGTGKSRKKQKVTIVHLEIFLYIINFDSRSLINFPCFFFYLIGNLIPISTGVHSTTLSSFLNLECARCGEGWSKLW